MDRSYMSRGLALLLAAALLLLSGCAMAPRFTGGTTPVAAVQLDRLYIYSFLDIRASELGPTLMTEIDRQLGDGLLAHGVQSQQHWFESDPIAAEYARAMYTSERIPVREVILRNIAQESAFGASYRLIIFPARTTMAGAWRHYSILWALEDVATQRTVWSTTSRSKHMNWVKNDEDSQERAQVLVDGVLAQMTAAGLLRDAPAGAQSASADQR